MQSVGISDKSETRETTSFASRRKSMKWSPSEDTMLLDLVAQHKNNWKLIGMAMDRPNIQVPFIDQC
jgi:hypothetical protein